MNYDKVWCPRKCGASFPGQPLTSAVLHECSRQRNGEKYADANKRVEIEVYVGGPDVGLETSDPKVGSNKPTPRREPAAPKPGKRQKKMNDEQEEATAPKPGRGYTVIELRTAHQAEMVKDIVKGTKAGAVSIEDRWVVVRNVDAQLVVDKAIGADVSEFEGRVLSFFVAVILLGNDKVTDSRNTLQARLIDVGRTTKGFKVGMKSDNKLEVSVGSKIYKTQKEALMVLAPDRVKAPARVETDEVVPDPETKPEPKKTTGASKKNVEPNFKKKAS